MVDGFSDFEKFNSAEAQRTARYFPIERWCDILFAPNKDWLIKGVLPRIGFAAIFGKPGSYKSFVALHIAVCVATGRDWAGRRTASGFALYIGAAGAAGLRKRKAGYAKGWPDLPLNIDFGLIPVAPNLGTEKSDLHALIAAVEMANIRPAIIVMDTLAKSIGAGDENGAGMTTFVGNASALAERFGCLVLAVHHTGTAEDAQRRPRGHSSLHGGLDARILCERQEGEIAATLTLQKLKDELSDVRLTARLSRVVVGYDQDGEEASTLIVDDVSDAGPLTARMQRGRIIPGSRLLLHEKLAQALAECGEEIRPFADGPKLRAVAEDQVRKLYYAALAEKAEADEAAYKLANRQRQAFSRAVNASLNAKEAIASDVGGRRMLWLP